jgi:hypothetical protein
MFARLRCRLFGGHYWIRTVDRGRRIVRLECLHCGAYSSGWILEAPAPGRRFWRRLFQKRNPA